jgi:hypothetical protein
LFDASVFRTSSVSVPCRMSFLAAAMRTPVRGLAR